MASLALGTVQFGLAYGIANRTGQVSQAEIGEILQRAGDAGVSVLDTAIAYGESETRLGRANVSGWRVVTKLPPFPKELAAAGDWVHEQVRGSLERLRIPRLDALLLHRSADLLGPHGEACRRALAELRSAGTVGATGVSIYHPGELDSLWPVWKPDLVQAPFNVFDRRLVRSGWADRLAASGVRIHARSAFLQGLLLMPAAQRPAQFARWSSLFDRWDGWCRERGTTALAAALDFVLDQPWLECAVVGVDSRAHLEQIIAARVPGSAASLPDLACDDLELVDPSRWKSS